VLTPVRERGFVVTAFSKLIEDLHAGPWPRDRESLTLLIQALKPSLVNEIKQPISKMLNALAICLLQQQEMLAGLPDDPRKEALTRTATVVCGLCGQIQAELGDGAKSIKENSGASSAAA